MIPAEFVAIVTALVKRLMRAVEFKWHERCDSCEKVLEVYCWVNEEQNLKELFCLDCSVERIVDGRIRP